MRHYDNPWDVEPDEPSMRDYEATLAQECKSMSISELTSELKVLDTVALKRKGTRFKARNEAWTL